MLTGMVNERAAVAVDEMEICDVLLNGMATNDIITE